MPRPNRDPEPPKIENKRLYRQYDLKDIGERQQLDYVTNEEKITSSVLTTYFDAGGHFQVVCILDIPENEKEILGKIL